MALKIPKLADTKPTKMTLLLGPDLQSELEVYAKVYALSYGKQEKIEDLIPSMLEAFMAGDAGFKRERKAIPTPT